MVTVLTVIIAVVIGSPVVAFIAWLIPEWRNDARWYAYMDAYDVWERNGRQGEMPKSKDFGWIPPSKR